MPALSTAENLPIATLRLYVLPYRHPASESPDWRGGFVAAGIGPVAVPAFEALFRIVTRTARRALDVRCPHAVALGVDEAAFLRLTAFHQRNRLAAAGYVLADWLPPAAARMAAMPALGLAFAMTRGGLILPLRSAPRVGIEPASNARVVLLH